MVFISKVIMDLLMFLDIFKYPILKIIFKYLYRQSMEFKLNLCAKINIIKSKIIFQKKITAGYVKTGNKAILNGLLEKVTMIFIKKIP